MSGTTDDANANDKIAAPKTFTSTSVATATAHQQQQHQHHATTTTTTTSGIFHHRASASAILPTLPSLTSVSIATDELRSSSTSLMDPTSPSSASFSSIPSPISPSISVSSVSDSRLRSSSCVSQADDTENEEFIRAPIASSYISPHSLISAANLLNLATGTESSASHLIDRRASNSTPELVNATSLTTTSFPSSPLPHTVGNQGYSLRASSTYSSGNQSPVSTKSLPTIVRCISPLPSITNSISRSQSSNFSSLPPSPQSILTPSSSLSASANVSPTSSPRILPSLHSPISTAPCTPPLPSFPSLATSGTPATAPWLPTPGLAQQLPISLLHGTFSRDGTFIRYYQYGPRFSQLPAMVFIHGWACDATYWSRQVAHFARLCTVITFDLAGHGNSATTRTKWTIESLAADTVAVIKAAALERVMLVAHSMGGPCALIAASLLPGKVLGVVGVDSLYTLNWPQSEESLTKLIAALTHNFTEATRTMWAGAFPRHCEPSLRETLIHDMSHASPCIAPLIQAHFAFQSQSLFSSLSIPILSLAWRTGNPQPNADHAETISHMASDYRFIDMGDVGHFFHLTCFEEVNRILEQFENALNEGKGTSSIALGPPHSILGALSQSITYSPNMVVSQTPYPHSTTITRPYSFPISTSATGAPRLTKPKTKTKSSTHTRPRPTNISPVAVTSSPSPSPSSSSSSLPSLSPHSPYSAAPPSRNRNVIISSSFTISSSLRTPATSNVIIDRAPSAPSNVHTSILPSTPRNSSTSAPVTNATPTPTSTAATTPTHGSSASAGHFHQNSFGSSHPDASSTS